MLRYSDFYRELAGGRLPLTFQTFPERAEDKADEGRRKALTRIIHGTVEDVSSQLHKLNEDGAGIFVCVNRMDGKWRGLNHLTGIQSYFVDVDGLDSDGKTEKFKELRSAVHPPSMIVESRNGLHAYWLAMEGENPDNYREVEEGLIHAFGGDKAAKDAARVLRAPGFFHLKAGAYLVWPLLVSNLRYTAAELAAEYPAPQPVYKYQEQYSAPQSTEAPSGTKLLAVMDYCAALWTPGNRHEMALSLAGKLYWWGVPEHEALGIVERVCRMAGDPDTQDRIQAVRSTYRRGDSGSGVSTYALKGMKF